jgi:hypothetical protein
MSYFDNLENKFLGKTYMDIYILMKFRMKLITYIAIFIGKGNKYKEYKEIYIKK